MILKTDGVDVDMVMIDWYTGLRGRVMSNLWVELAEQRRTRLSRVNSHHIFSYRSTHSFHSSCMVVMHVMQDIPDTLLRIAVAYA